MHQPPETFSFVCLFRQGRALNCTARQPLLSLTCPRYQPHATLHFWIARAWTCVKNANLFQKLLCLAPQKHIPLRMRELSSRTMQISGFLMTWNPMILTDHCQTPAQLRVPLSLNALNHRRAQNPRLPSQDRGPPLLHYHRWKASLDCLHQKSWWV